MVARLSDALFADTSATCFDPTTQGCTDSDALNYDVAASIDDGSCQERMYGCMDPRAVNYDPMADSYDPDTTNSSLKCHGAYCTTAAACVSIFSHESGGGDAGIANTCSAVDSQFSAGDDVHDRLMTCEAAGVGVLSGYPTVCRYAPALAELCAYSHADANGDQVHGGPADCSCPSGTTLEVFTPGGFSTCSPTAPSASASQVAACALHDASSCASDPLCTFHGESEYPTNSRDECELTVYNGTAYDACSSPENRPCAGEAAPLSDHYLGDDGAHDGWPGRHCTDYRVAHACPDHEDHDTLEASSWEDMSTNTSFTCVEPNEYWLEDFQCNCAYQAFNRYDDTTAATCGTDVIFTDLSTGTEVTNYELTLLLPSSSTTRAHLCRVIGGTSTDCARDIL